MKKIIGLKPGETAPVSGLYQRIGPWGKKGSEVTVVKGEPMPPTTEPGNTYVLVRMTRHKKS